MRVTTSIKPSSSDAIAATPSSSGSASSAPRMRRLPAKRVRKSSACVLCSAAIWAGASCDVFQKPPHMVVAQASISSSVGVSRTRIGAWLVSAAAVVSSSHGSSSSMMYRSAVLLSVVQADHAAQSRVVQQCWLLHMRASACLTRPALAITRVLSAGFSANYIKLMPQASVPVTASRCRVIHTKCST